MKFLFITYDGLTDPLGQSQIIPYVTGLQKKGLNYSIFSVEKKAAFAENKAIIKETLSSQSIGWTNISYTKRPAFLSTVYDILRMRKEIQKLIEEKGITHLHCRSYVSMYAAFPLVLKYKLKVIFDMRGFWIDERIEGGLWNKSNPMIRQLVRYLKKQEKKWFELADLIISLTYKGKKTIQELYPKVDMTKISVIPCCADEALFDPAIIDPKEKEALKNQLGIAENQKVLAYAGSIGTWYLSEEMMSSFQYLNNMGVVDKFLMLTKEKAENIEQMARKLDIDMKDLIIKSAKRIEMPKYLSVIDLGIFYIKPSFSKTASSPTKLGELLLMGKAVICNSGIGDLDAFFDKNKVGLCIDINSIENFDLKKCQDLMNIDSDKVRQSGLSTLSLSLGIDNYYQSLSQL